MSSRLSSIASVSPSTLEIGLLEERLKAMRTCCSHAREAGMDGRLSAAHGLFQTALLFFERARSVSLPGDEVRMRLAWEELDYSAPWVYSVEELKGLVFLEVTPSERFFVSRS